MNLENDKRIVLTLDAGGTNLVFNAIQSGDELHKPVRLKTKSESLEELLKKIITGFEQVSKGLTVDAISFCFPGPADYPNGIIGDLENLPLFRGGVPLKDMLEEHFKVPVFINNDGDLFTLGEAIAGLLPEINQKLKEAGNPKRYKNLFGATFGTGFGGGMVSGGQLHIGDNSAGGEVNRIRNKLYPETSAEDSVNIRAIRRVYARESGTEADACLGPREIAEIAEGKREGNRNAALIAYDELAMVAGDALANALTLFDGLVVLGGGLSRSYQLFIQNLVDEMNTPYLSLQGQPFDRMEIKAMNLEDPEELEQFLKDHSKMVPVPFSNKTVPYDPSRYIGVGVSRLGTSKAVSVGAYAFALKHLA
jgi:glucokinase